MASADHGSHVPASDEPETPMWLPALGAVLFLIVGIWWGTRPSEPAPAPPASEAAAENAGGGAAATATATAKPAPPPGH